MKPIVEVPWRSPSNELANLKYRYMLGFDLPEIRALLPGIVDEGWLYGWADYGEMLTWLNSDESTRGTALIWDRKKRKHHKGRKARYIRRWYRRNRLNVSVALEWLKRQKRY